MTLKIGTVTDLTGIGPEILTDAYGNVLAELYDGNFVSASPTVSSESPTIVN